MKKIGRTKISPGRSLARLLTSLLPAAVAAALLATLCLGLTALYGFITSTRVPRDAWSFWYQGTGLFFILTGGHQLLGKRPRAMRKGYAHLYTGNELMNARRWNQAIPYLETSVKAFATLAHRNDMVRRSLAVILDNLALAYRHDGRYEAALAARRRALDIFGEMGMTADAAQVMYGIGLLYATDLDMPDQGRQYLERALELAVHTGRPWLEAACRDLLGTILERAGDHGGARTLYRGAIAVFTDLNARQDLSLAHANLARLDFLVNDLPGALENLDQSVTIAREEPASAEWLTLLVRGCIQVFYENPTHGVHCLHEFLNRGSAREFIDESGEPETEETDARRFLDSALYTLGLGALAMAHIKSDYFRVFLPLWSPSQCIMPGDKAAPGTDDLIGAGLFAWKGKEGAIDYLREKTRPGFCRERRLAAVYAAAGDFGMAGQCLEDALPQAIKEKSPAARVACRLSLVTAHWAAHENHRATELLEGLIRDVGTGDTESDVFLDICLHMAFLASRLGMTDALRELTETITRELRDQRGNQRNQRGVRLLAGLGDIYRHLGLHEEAARFFEGALRGAGGGAALKLKLARWQCRMEQGIRGGDGGDTTAESAELTGIIGEINAVRTQLAGGIYQKYGVEYLPVTGATASSMAIDRMMAGAGDIHGAFGLAAGESAENTLKQYLGTRPSPEVVCQYHCTENKIYYFIMGSGDPGPRGGVLDFPVPRLRHCLAELEYEMQDFRAHKDGKITGKITEITGLSPILRDMAAPLVGPLRPYLEKTGPEHITRICLVPHGPLHLLPLHALGVNNRCLLEYCPVFFAPAIGGYLQDRRARQYPRGALVMGNPSGDLTDAALEALAVGETLGARPLLLGESRMAAWQGAPGHEIIHISSHGYFDPANPARSGVVLADGVITIEKIRQMHLDARLVTLSACETGMGGGGSEQFIGLSHALLNAGAASVVVSLWPVDQRASALLMQKMYTAMKTQNQSPARALRTAQLALATSKQWGHPYYWAPFMVVGRDE